HHTGEAIGGRLDGVLVAARRDTVLEQRRQQAAARAAGANEQRHHLAVMVRSLDRHVFLDGVSPVLVERNEPGSDGSKAAVGVEGKVLPDEPERIALVDAGMTPCDRSSPAAPWRTRPPAPAARIPAGR